MTVEELVRELSRTPEEELDVLQMLGLAPAPERPAADVRRNRPRSSRLTARAPR